MATSYYNLVLKARPQKEARDAMVDNYKSMLNSTFPPPLTGHEMESGLVAPHPRPPRLITWGWALVAPHPRAPRLMTWRGSSSPLHVMSCAN